MLLVICSVLIIVSTLFPSTMEISVVVCIRNALHRVQSLDTWSPVARVVRRGFCAASLKKEYVIGEGMKLYTVYYI